MICLDCTHFIIRVMFDGLFEESFSVCELDGKPLVTNVLKCNKHDLKVIPDLREKIVLIPEELKVAKPVEEVALEPEKKGFVCEVCGKEVLTKLALIGHMRSHKTK